ncbi:MAG: HAD family hydrolase [Acetatifactor sp.]
MKAVIFDMDGVLFDTERLCMESWCVLAKEQGIPDMEIVFPKCIGRNAADTEEIVTDYYGEGFDYDTFRKKASDWFWQYIKNNGLPIKTGVKEILAYLKQEGYVVGLASSTRYSSVVNHLEEAGIKDYFSVIVTGDMVEHSKPKPDIYLLACEKLGVEPAKAYAVEDSYNGIRSAHAAGMKPVMVPDLLEPDEEMESLSFLICKDLLEVLAYLKEF